MAARVFRIDMAAPRGGAAHPQRAGGSAGAASRED